MQPNKIMYIDLANPPAKSYAPKKGEEMNRSTYSTMRYSYYGDNDRLTQCYVTILIIIDGLSALLL